MSPEEQVFNPPLLLTPLVESERIATQGNRPREANPKTTVMASFNVSDYDRWRAGYAHAVGDPKLLTWRIWRGQDDPNHVLIEETFDSADYARQVFTSEATRNAMTNDGVDLATLTLEYLDEAS